MKTIVSYYSAHPSWYDNKEFIVLVPSDKKEAAYHLIVMLADMPRNVLKQFNYDKHGDLYVKLKIDEKIIKHIVTYINNKIAE